jgi:hypothetical protein
MSRPQLFQLVEPNPAGAVVVVTFQQCDRDFILNRRMDLKSDIRSQLAKGKGSKVFQSKTERFWFNDLHHSRNRRIALGKQASKFDLEHIHHTHSIFTSPPKKRAYNPPSVAPSGPTIRPQNQLTPLPHPQLRGQCT